MKQYSTSDTPRLVIQSEGSSFLCICGNTDVGQGFYPCNRQGEEVEPDAQHWTTNRYVCDNCGRVIEQATLRIVGYRQNNTLTGAQRQAIDAEVARLGYP